MEVPFIWRFAFLAAEDAQSALNILSLSKRIYNYISLHDIEVARFSRWYIRNMQLYRRCKHLCGNNTEALHALQYSLRSFEVEYLHTKVSRLIAHMDSTFDTHFFRVVAANGFFVLFRSMIIEFQFDSHDIFRSAFDMALAFDHVVICRFILHSPHVCCRSVAKVVLGVHD